MKQLHDKQWFLDRVNKTIIRDDNKCCRTCEHIGKNGLKIRDKNHAEYIYEMQNDFANGGHYLNYRDIK